MNFKWLQVKNGLLLVLKKFCEFLHIKLDDLMALYGPYVLTILKI